MAAMNEEQFQLLLNKIDEVRISSDENKTISLDIKKSLAENVAKTDHLSRITNKISLRSNVHDVQIESIKARQNVMEQRWYSQNLLVCGIAEGGRDEDCEEAVHDTLTRLGIKHDGWTLQQAFRKGVYSKDVIRPIELRFHHPKDRDLAWKNRSALDDDVYLRPMYPSDVYRTRRVLQTVCNFAEKVPHYSGTVSITHANKLKLGKQLYDVSELYKLPFDLQKPVGMKLVDNIYLFYGLQAPFSNFYPASFNTHTAFSSSEQSYYLSMAHFYKDTKAAIAIMATDDPVEIKRIGKTIHDPRDGKWDDSKEAQEAMESALYAKFDQNDYLRRILFATGDAILAEANPHDTYWGIGLDRFHVDAPHQARWKGKNKLGFMLMNLRSQLKIKYNIV